jgi:hypothetical protein
MQFFVDQVGKPIIFQMLFQISPRISDMFLFGVGKPAGGYFFFWWSLPR